MHAGDAPLYGTPSISSSAGTCSSCVGDIAKAGVAEIHHEIRRIAREALEQPRVIVEELETIPRQRLERLAHRAVRREVLVVVAMVTLGEVRQARIAGQHADPRAIAHG